MDTGIIYHIFNTVNGKAYVGQTWGSLEKRWLAHLATKNSCRHLKYAIRKYGAASFVRSVLTGGLVTQGQMDYAEKYWIDYFDSITSGYNIREGGSQGRLSEATKHKLSLVRLGRKFSEEHKERLGRCHLGNTNWLGRKHSDATKRKISVSGLGRKNSQESKTKCAASHGGKPFIDQNGVRYETVRGAGRALGLNFTHIIDVLKGRRSSTGGYTFEYVKEKPCP